MELKGELVSASAAVVRQRGLSIAYQHPALVPDLTVYENLRCGCRPRPGKRGKTARNGRATQLLRVGCTAELGQRVASLSVVQRQLLEIAKSLAADPAVLILDEPTASLGADETRRCRRAAAAGRQRGRGGDITHRLAEVRELCQQVTVLRDGAVRGHSGSKMSRTRSSWNSSWAGRGRRPSFRPRVSRLRPAPATDQACPGGRDFSNRAFGNVPLTVARGEIVGVAGIVGNGQSEFLRAMAGWCTPPAPSSCSGGKLKTARPAAASRPAPSTSHLTGCTKACSALCPSARTRSSVTQAVQPLAAS